RALPDRDDEDIAINGHDIGAVECRIEPALLVEYTGAQGGLDARELPALAHYLAYTPGTVEVNAFLPGPLDLFIIGRQTVLARFVLTFQGHNRDFTPKPPGGPRNVKCHISPADDNHLLTLEVAPGQYAPAHLIEKGLSIHNPGKILILNRVLAEGQDSGRRGPFGDKHGLVALLSQLIQA